MKILQPLSVTPFGSDLYHQELFYLMHSPQIMGLHLEFYLEFHLEFCFISN